MTTFFLVRHGAHDRLDRFLDGRRPGVHLNALGHRQAAWAAARLAGHSVDAVLSSPLERTRETAEAIAARCDLVVRVEPALEELDFGCWSGKTIEALKPLEDWRQWNEARAIAWTPAGDTMRAAQGRMLDLIDRLRIERPNARYRARRPLRSAQERLVLLPRALARQVASHRRQSRLDQPSRDRRVGCHGGRAQRDDAGLIGSLNA